MLARLHKTKEEEEEETSGATADCCRRCGTGSGVRRDGRGGRGTGRVVIRSTYHSHTRGGGKRVAQGV